MNLRNNTHRKNLLGVLALLAALAALQSPLWRPAEAPRSLTAKSGGTVTVTYDRELENAMIFQKATASLSAGAKGELVIHGHAPGRTRLLIRYKDGASRVYEVVVLPG